MNDNFRDIFVETSCVSQQELLDYLQGRLSDADRHRVEMHVADCPFCSDALEGLSAIPEKEKIPAVIRQMKWKVLQNLRRKNRRKRSKEFYTSLAVTTLIILFIVLACFFAYHFMVRR
ncbi:zf-HC2 domain-containing protein [Chitinophaga horti]|uniref:Zf-HC2 domain-containing protein n=1 Tax=Chitinophaga horti TaxID=2920382 RepID=A0ABY6J978_9BACT|nr:zf-HC2 domain-containing protein [Chitinophaga horti]UYQ94719.1 zf-HC2 domain-containing protein [Chitinophaga horti]